MKKIKLIVSDLGPIKQKTEIELNQLVLLSGPSSSGKSYVALLLYYIYSVLSGDELIRFFLDKKMDASILNEAKDLQGELFCLKKQDFQDWVDLNAIYFMRNMLNYPEFDANIHVCFDEMPDNIIFRYEKNVVKKLNGEEIYNNIFIDGFDSKRELDNSMSLSGSLLFVRLFSEYLSSLYHMNVKNTFLLPPSRGSLVVVPSFLKNHLRSVSGMYREFFNMFDFIKDVQIPSVFFDQLSKETLLEGSIDVVDGQLRYKTDVFDLPLTAAAASIRELSPIQLLLQKGVISNYSILFEEPESNLHPELQIEVVDLISKLLKGDTHFIVTTHSDFILRRINDLLRISLINKKLPLDESSVFFNVNNIDENLAIDINNVTSYYFKKEESEVCVMKHDIIVEKGITLDTIDNVLDKTLPYSIVLKEKIEEIYG